MCLSQRHDPLPPGVIKRSYAYVDAGPGEATGCFALESAMDELAYSLNLDPLELRLRNQADTDPERKLPLVQQTFKRVLPDGC